MSYDPESEVDKLCCQLEEVKDERDHLRTQLKSLEGDCAVMRHALESVLNDSPQPDLSRITEWLENRDAMMRKALTTSAGKSLLDKLSGYEKRLVEAEWLLDETNRGRFTIGFIKRRDAWLKGVSECL